MLITMSGCGRWRTSKCGKVDCIRRDGGDQIVDSTTTMVIMVMVQDISTSLTPL